MTSRMFDVAQTISRAAKNDTLSQTDGSISGGGGGGVTALDYDSNGVLFNNSLVDSASLNSGDLRYIEHTDTLAIWNDSDGQWWKVDIGTAPLSNQGILTYASTDYSASGSTTFSKSTSGFTTFTVAGNTMVVDVEMWGAGGGAQKGSTGGDGSAGGYSKARLSLPAGEYAFLVGAGGHAGGGGTSARAFPDGGKYTGTRTDGASGAGGGGSTRLGLKISDGITLADSSTYDTTASFNNSTYNGYILISGGGAGSAAYINQGLDNAASTNPDYGVGGGLKGGDGSLYWSSDGVSTLGFGGTQSEGGAAGTGGRDTGTVAEAGGKYYGANGEGAGAGGGYYGGGGSQGYYSQAGGGSGYIDSSYCVAGQDNFTAINGGQTSSTYYDNTVADATYPNAGEGPATDDTAGYDGLFKLTVIS